MTKISIIVPVYNKEAFIKRCLDSILNQSFKDFELIIVNDGSTDNSLALCNSYKDSRIRIFNIENSGVSNARNIGIDAATGEYITFIDSDDFIPEYYLEKLLSEEHDFIIGGLKKVSMAGEQIESVIPPFTGLQPMDVVCKTFYEDQVNTGIYGYVACKVIRRSIIADNRIWFDGSIKLAEDYDFYLQIYPLINEVFFIKEPLYYYVQETLNSGLNVPDSKVDFYKQIEIQNKTISFLESKQELTVENRIRYEKFITGYFYTIMLHSNLSSFSCFLDTINRLKEYRCYDNTDKGLIKIIIWLYNHKLYKVIYLLLKLKIRR